jgi:hypothetical protein
MLYTPAAGARTTTMSGKRGSAVAGMSWAGGGGAGASWGGGGDAADANGGGGGGGGGGGEDEGEVEVLVKKEGFLFKRSTNVRRDWKRRWFELAGGQLRYRREARVKVKGEGGDVHERSVFGDPVSVCEVLLCTVRVCDSGGGGGGGAGGGGSGGGGGGGDGDHLRFTFEIISPNRRSYMLQVRGAS